MYTTWKKFIIMIIIIRFGIDPGIYKTIISAVSTILWYSLNDEYQKSYSGTRRSLGSWTVLLPSFFFSFLRVFKNILYNLFFIICFLNNLKIFYFIVQNNIIHRKPFLLLSSSFFYNLLPCAFCLVSFLLRSLFFFKEWTSLPAC